MWRENYNMTQLISYYGGKERIASKIISIIPKHSTYAEPFSGGASVFWKKPISKLQQYCEILNDHDKRLINFYRVFQNKKTYDELYHRLCFTPCSESEYEKSKDILNDYNNDTYSDIDRAWAYFVSINQSFSNILSAGWARSFFPINNTKTWNNKIMKLNYFFNRLKNVSFSCESALDCIKRYDRKETFFYCDPPYPGANQGHYKGYTLDDFKNLIELLSQIKGSCIVSSYEVPIKIPEDFEKFVIKASMLANTKSTSNKDRMEVLYRRVP